MSETMLGKAGHSPCQMLQSVLNWLVGSTWGAFVVIFILAFGIRAHFVAPPYIALLTILAFSSLKDVVPALTILQRVVTLVPLITFPPIYYSVPCMPRYRMPVDWTIRLLAGAEVWHLIGTGRQDHSRG